MARRYKSLHHNLQPGENVIFHREHRSPRNRSEVKKGKLQKWQPKKRHKFKAEMKNSIEDGFFDLKRGKRKRY